MHAAAVRPYVTTGIALVGVSVIAVTPIAPSPPPDIWIANPAVQLTAAPSPFELYPQVVGATLQNAGILAVAYLGVAPLGMRAPSGPFPIIRALLGNEVAAPESCNRIQCNEIDIQTALEWLGKGAVSWVIGGVLATGAALLDIADAVVRLDPIAFLNAVLDTPALIAHAVLNGFPEWSGPPLFETFTNWPGLLNPGAPGFVRGVPISSSPGLIGALIFLDQAIGAAISELFHPPSTPLAPANEPPEPRVMTVSLSTGSTLDSGLTPTDQGPAEAASEQAQQGLANANATDGLATAEAPPEQANELAKTGPNTYTQVQRGLDTSVAGAATATDGLAQARSNASAQGQHGLDTATSAINDASTGIRDGNKVQPGQVDGNSAPSGDDVVKAAEPIGDQPGSTLSKPGNDTKKAETSTGTTGTEG